MSLFLFRFFLLFQFGLGVLFILLFYFFDLVLHFFPFFVARAHFAVGSGVDIFLEVVFDGSYFGDEYLLGVLWRGKIVIGITMHVHGTSADGLPDTLLPDCLFPELGEEMVSLHVVVHVDKFPVAEVNSVGLEELVVLVVTHGDLWRGLELTLEDGDVVAGVAVTIESLGVLAGEAPDVFEADGHSEEHARGQVVHLLAQSEGDVSHVLLQVQLFEHLLRRHLRFEALKRLNRLGLLLLFFTLFILTLLGLLLLLCLCSGRLFLLLPGQLVHDHLDLGILLLVKLLDFQEPLEMLLVSDVQVVVHVSSEILMQIELQAVILQVLDEVVIVVAVVFVSAD